MHEWFLNLLIAFVFVFGAIFILCGMLLVLVGWSTLRLSFGQSGWVKIPAEIISVSIETRTLDGSKMYLPKVAYRFSAGGTLMTSSRMRLVEKMYSTKGKAQRKLNKFPPGTTVMASYPVDQPNEAVLEPGGGFSGFLLLLFGLAMVIGPLFLASSEGYDTTPISIIIILVFSVLFLGTINSRRREKRARRDGLLPPLGCGTDADVEQLLNKREKLLAIRLYREIHNTDLKTAREAVDNMKIKQTNSED